MVARQIIRQGSAHCQGHAIPNVHVTWYDDGTVKMRFQNARGIQITETYLTARSPVVSVRKTVAT